MSCYVDPLFHLPSLDPQAYRVGIRHRHLWSHLWCDPGDEELLHAIALRIGMRRAWFQNKPSFPHYDLVPPKRILAISYGAIEKPLHDWLRERRALSSPADPGHQQ